MDYRIAYGSRSRITTEAPFDRAVKWLSVYATGLLGLFLIIKEHLLDDAMVCQPINRFIRVNLSYDQAQASYDKAYCSASMLDFSHNIIRASGPTLTAPDAVPGVTVLEIKGDPKIIYQGYFPYALLIQAVLSCGPVLLWKLWSTEFIVTAIRYVSTTCKDIVKKETLDHPKMESTPKISPRRSSSMETQRRIGELDLQVAYWLEQKFLTRLYITKLVLTEVVLIIALCVYFTCGSLFITNFKSQFICRVDKQYLVNCTLSLAELYKTIWLANIAILDACLILTTFQFLYILCCMMKKRNFFFLTYIGIGPSINPATLTDAHLISYFCHHNLTEMPPEILMNPARQASMSRDPSSTLITFGESEVESPNSTLGSFHTASDVEVPPLKTKDKRKYSKNSD